MLSISNYKTVGELKDKDRNVDIFGVVKFFQGLPKTKKGDHHMMITLIDDSVGEDVEAGVRCNIFEKDPVQLPNVTKVGDIVLLKQMRVTSFNGRLQVQRTSNFQWVVFGITKNSAGKHIVQTKSTSLTAPSFKQYEQLRLKELLEFLTSTEKKILESELVHVEENNLIGLDSLTPGTYVDIIVQVVAICEFQNRAEKALLLKVADGTKVSFSSLYQMGVVKTRKVNDLERATLGYSCEISVFDDHVDSVDRLIVGDFIKIVNLHVKGVSHQLLVNWKHETRISGSEKSDEWHELIVHSGTKYNRGIRKLSPCDTAVTAVKERVAVLLACYYDAKATIEKMVVELTGQEKNLSSSMTNFYASKPLSSISSIITCLTDQCGKFRLLGRVVRIEPKLFKDIIVGKCITCHKISRPFSGTECQISSHCVSCDRDSLNIMYFLRLMLQDDTGLLHILVMGEDANYFFNGAAPSDLVQDRPLMSRFEDILGALGHCENDCSVDSPVIDVCVAKECLSKNSSFMYRLFGTKLDV